MLGGHEARKARCIPPPLPRAPGPYKRPAPTCPGSTHPRHVGAQMSRMDVTPDATTGRRAPATTACAMDATSPAARGTSHGRSPATRFATRTVTSRIPGYLVNQTTRAEPRRSSGLFAWGDERANPTLVQCVCVCYPGAAQQPTNETAHTFRASMQSRVLKRVFSAALWLQRKPPTLT